MTGSKSKRGGSAAAARYGRASALVGAVLNKFHNGSVRAVDPFVVRTLKEHEARLLGLQCFVEQVTSAPVGLGWKLTLCCSCIVGPRGEQSGHEGQVPCVRPHSARVRHLRALYSLWGDLRTGRHHVGDTC
jgi:hypothetical protein